MVGVFGRACSTILTITAMASRQNLAQHGQGYQPHPAAAATAAAYLSKAPAQSAPINALARQFGGVSVSDKENYSQPVCQYAWPADRTHGRTLPNRQGCQACAALAGPWLATGSVSCPLESPSWQPCSIVGDELSAPCTKH
ncbi:hypothetical protein BC831DRAFT_102108 [Entophlyctis helioformis]|nr:hypothetical protein BC831DRAFT_102108 [Entophlyctis helioformis]